MVDDEIDLSERPDWRSKVSDPPVPHTLPELMLLVLDMAEEDADALEENPPNTSSRTDFEALAGYDLYEELRKLLTGPLFHPEGTI